MPFDSKMQICVSREKSFTPASKELRKPRGAFLGEMALEVLRFRLVTGRILKPYPFDLCFLRAVGHSPEPGFARPHAKNDKQRVVRSLNSYVL